MSQTSEDESRFDCQNACQTQVKSYSIFPFPTTCSAIVREGSVAIGGHLVVEKYSVFYTLSVGGEKAYSLWSEQLS
jgi:hypothetical protein